MLNLVQVQERLRDVPMQALMQYANGSNPQIPPFLALGELNRRKKMQESAAADQAAEMEGAPTIKEQIEQATGLMALQGSRQKQAARQQAGLQAAMPMAAPNTTTSEPAQLAAGGFLDDIVVPRDYQAGGMAMNPDMIKKLMMLKAMKQRQPKSQGLAGIPTDMFKRGDYAGGGIVAFAGEEGSFVESSPGFYELDKEGEEQSSMTEEQRRMYELIDRLKAIKSMQDRKREAGLGEPPDERAERLKAIEGERQRFDEADTVARRVMALNPLQIGRSMGEYLTKRETGQTDIERRMAEIKDLKAKAAYDAKLGNLKDARAEELDAINKERELLKDISRAGQEGALAEQARAGRTSNLREMYKTELAGLVSEGKDPNDPAVQREAMRRAAYYTATLAGPRVEATERGTEAANERAAVDKYSELFDPRKLLYGPLSDEMDAAAARDKKEGTGNKYQNEIRLREYNRIRQGLSLPPARSLPGSAPAGGSTGGSAPPPPPGFVVPKK